MSLNLRIVDRDELRKAMPMDVAIAALARGILTDPVSPQRSFTTYGDNKFVTMPAGSDVGFGAKLLTIAPGNPARSLPLIQGLYVLFSAETLAPEYIVDGEELTRIRTAAVSALVVDYLSRRDSKVAFIFGAGVQAAAHVEAVAVVREIEEFVVVNDRRRQSAESLVQRLVAAGFPCRTGSSDEVGQADIVCTCTSSPTPVLSGGLLAPGACVVAVGSYKPDTREVDSETLRRARVFVEDRASILHEGPGDLAIPASESSWSESAIVGDIVQLVRGTVSPRDSDQDINFFKSVGMAYEDLLIAAAAVRRIS